MNNIVGYCTIKNNATTGVGLNLETFMGKNHLYLGIRITTRINCIRISYNG